MSTLRNSQVEVLIDGCEWHRINAILDETALILAIDETAIESKINYNEKNIYAANTLLTKRIVRITKKTGHGLGISIQGGVDTSRPIIISKIFANMAADQTGQLMVGDIILSVNGESLKNIKHDEAVQILKCAGKVVNLEVQYRPDLFVKDPYNKENILRRIHWSNGENENQRKDHKENSKSFSLKLAFVTRTSLKNEDPENRTIEIWSPSVHLLTLRCSNSLEADSWFESLHACAETLLIQALAQVNLVLGQNPQVKRMGWLAEQFIQDGVTIWQPIFAALTMNDLLFYESVPAIKQEWANPCLTCPLIATRVVQTTSRTFPVIAGLSDLISFTTRTGTQENVQTHVFRLETHRDLSGWVKNIIYYTYEACIETNKVSAPCIWQEKQCELLIQLDKGISLLNASGQILWEHPFEAIRSTGDDGQQYLWIDFGPMYGEQEINLLGSLKAIVFILHSFLATKVQHLGLYA